MKRAYWLVKSEPFKYPFAKLVEDGKTTWDGVRSYEARNNLRAMKKGDLALFYHSNEGKEVVGVARVTREAYPDSTSDEDWSVVDFAPAFALKEPVTLTSMRENGKLSKMALLKKSRLSVVPVTKDEFDAVLHAGKTKVRS